MSASAATLMPPPSLAEPIASGLARVGEVFESHLQTQVPAVEELCRHVERYRGKMLRPTMVLVSALACDPGSGEDAISESHVCVGAVIEMIHMATLVHDDVLDEASLRRGGQTVSALRGNELAVILGDFLLSRSFHLCSSLDSQAIALRVGEVTSTVCEGEMLQLANRGNLQLSESTYFDIIGRKTASLIGLACEMGPAHDVPDAGLARRMYDIGFKLGCAFQIQDDILDITGDESVVGKSLGRDIAKGKLTLPVLRHIESIPPDDRPGWLGLLDRAQHDETARAQVIDAIASGGGVASAAGHARRLVEEARLLIAGLPESDARGYIDLLAQGVVRRSR